MVNTLYLGGSVFLIVNMAMIGFAVEAGLYGVLTQQLVFLFTSALGLWNSAAAKKA